MNEQSFSDEAIDLPSQEIQTTGLATHHSSALGEIGGALLSLPSNIASESKTWGFTRDPYDLLNGGGTAMFRMEELRFTIVRAKLENGGLRCYMTMSWLVTSFGWTSQYGPTPAINFDLNVKNAAGGVLIPWRFSQHFICGNSRSSAVSLTDFDPQVYDIIDYVSMIINGFRSYRC
jgi:hypothetical protein